MTKNVTTISTSNGNVKLDAEELLGFNRRALAKLDDIAELEKDFKEIVIETAEATGIKAGTVSAYFKDRFKSKTKATKAKGDLFAAIDDKLDNKQSN